MIICDEVTGTCGIGWKAWEGNNIPAYCKVVGETVVAKTAKLKATAMTSKQYPCNYYTEETIKHSKDESVGKPATDRRLKDIISGQGCSPEGEKTESMIQTDTTDNLAHVQNAYTPPVSKNGSCGSQAGATELLDVMSTFGQSKLRATSVTRQSKFHATALHKKYQHHKHERCRERTPSRETNKNYAKRTPAGG